MVDVENRGVLMQDKNHSELEWLAFQYISGEMSAVEAELFEGRLAEDQRAREAVARAVEVAQVSLMAMEHVAAIEPARQTKRTRSRPLVWTLCGVAASVAVAIMVVPWSKVLPKHQDNLVHNAVVGLETRDLAIVWATARTDLAAELAVADDESLPGNAAHDGSGTDEIETPSWMFIAVAGLTGGRDRQKPVVE